MIDIQSLCFDLKEARQTFERTLSCFEEKDSTFVPVEGMYSVAQQVAHTAQTVEWFVHGAFAKDGFDLNFAKHHERIA
ncbi:MAG: DinB family protein, partial [Candidatus Hydrogenedentes bacterium]|nr:DinB family protein [Candidatus Hydrogenedentota bacterium]